MEVLGPHYLNPLKIPKHIAMIMDGNGRWALNKGQDRVWGHSKGIANVRKVLRYTNTLGVKYLTLYAFSEENWKRPENEINFIFSLIGEYLKTELNELEAQNVRVEYIGDIASLPREVRKNLEIAHRRLSKGTGLKLIIAISYGSRSEIVKACKNLASEICQKKMNPEDITQKTFSQFLQTSPYPDPDLLIRTSGELRVSNFLLWQLAYAELYFSPRMWPEFEPWHYLEAVSHYQSRKRRYGAIVSQ